MRRAQEAIHGMGGKEGNPKGLHESNVIRKKREEINDPNIER
jgi:hypothetical protein